MTPFDVVISRRCDEANRVVSLELSPIDGRALPSFHAGDHIDVHLGARSVRQYSLCNDPSDADRYRIAVLLELESRGGSAAIHADYRVGRHVRIGAPRSGFGLVEPTEHSILIAGGIGITPLLAMAYRLESLGSRFSIHYCAKTRSRAPFADELQSSFGHRLTTYYSDGPAQQRFAVETVVSMPNRGVHMYVCGPAAFMSRVVTYAKSLGWPNDHIHTEAFNALLDRSGDVFTVKAAFSNIAVQIAPGQSIAQALLDHGVDVPVACEQGICGSCMTRVLEGIPDHRDHVQNDREKEANTNILICCSRAKSKVLVLDI